MTEKNNLYVEWLEQDCMSESPIVSMGTFIHINSIHLIQYKITYIPAVHIANLNPFWLGN